MFNAIYPARGVDNGLLLPAANTDAMDLYLAKIRTVVTSGSHVVLVLDEAGWHQNSNRIRMPENISLLHLSSCFGVNPVENVWAFLNGNTLSNRVFNSCGAVVDPCCTAWN